MSKQICKSIRQQLPDYLDEKLGASDSERIRAHLAVNSEQGTTHAIQLLQGLSEGLPWPLIVAPSSAGDTGPGLHLIGV